MLIHLLVLLIVQGLCFGAKYTCDFTIWNSICTISGLNIAENDIAIEPVKENPSAITKLILQGNISALTGGFCQVLSNLETFYADEVSLELIKESTFYGCEKLERIEMKYNKIKHIEKNTFKGLKELQYLIITGGIILVFDVDLTDLKQLIVLELTSLNISVFPANTLREQKQLQDLHLDSNNLFNLDVENILKYTPNLDLFLFQNNVLKCSRQREINMLLNKKLIKVVPPVQYLLSADPYNITFDETSCLSDEEWLSKYNSSFVINN